MRRSLAPASRPSGSLFVLGLLASIGTLGLATVARADVVDQPPMSCPAGSTPATSHSGPYCAPQSCVVGGVCPGGGTCMAVRQCIETRACGGQTFPDAAPCTLENLVGPCNADGSCAVGVCMDRGACPTSGGSASGCGCQLAGRAPMGGLAAALALGVAVLTQRRRRRGAARAA